MDFILDEVVSIEDCFSDSLRYDITVDGNHNFFANGILVHNCQNLLAELAEWKADGSVWEVTEKLDGSSMTVYVKDGEIGVCSRNIDLARNEDNSFWKTALALNLDEILLQHAAITGQSLALQGELIGEGIQGNKYNRKGQDLFVFDIFDIDKGNYLLPEERQAFCLLNGIKHVPILGDTNLVSATISSILAMAENKSVLNPETEAEGIVFKAANGGVSFKAISNKFLLKNND